MACSPAFASAGAAALFRDQFPLAIEGLFLAAFSAAAGVAAFPDFPQELLYGRPGLLLPPSLPILVYSLVAGIELAGDSLDQAAMVADSWGGEASLEVKVTITRKK